MPNQANWLRLRSSVTTMAATCQASGDQSGAFLLGLVTDEMTTIELAHPELGAHMAAAYVRWHQDRVAVLADSEVERADLLAEAFAAGWAARNGGTL